VCAKRFIKSDYLRYGGWRVKMNRGVSSLRFGFDAGHAGSTCAACGEEFEEPLLAMVFSDSLVEEYYACPKCLSKVAAVGRGKAVKIDEVEAAEEAVEPVAAEVAVECNVEGHAGCVHHLGYLKHRGKNVPIPEGCLTCSKMIECMY
jgi:DNA-directed RNA polymerase subunit RPC12/RpoP